MDSVEKWHDGIAVIGIAGRFPKAENVNQFWENLANGVDCIDTININKDIYEQILPNKKLVPRGGRISGPDLFDASFFGYNPKEAALIDPQHRIFLECGWEAIEDAGYNVSKIKCSVGVFASCGMNHYLIQNIIANPNANKNYNEIQVVIGNDKDFLATRLSYKLNFKGPSYDIQSACSSSLTAVHVASQNLLLNQCDMAIAGGVFLQIPWWNGYVITDGDIRSPDGVCRPFDKNANGTVFGEGAGVVVLKRLQNAIKDNDNIYAVIKGMAVNNDGSMKAGYTTPSIDGQSNVVIMALDCAGISASEISYVEAHGTGTPIGDPIEIAALNNAYRKYTDKKGYCAIGSVKAAIGHLDAAAGIAGLIKTILVLYKKKIPSAINFEIENPLLKIEDTPFYINKQIIDWDSKSEIKRYAGVSSLGVGGTNAHIILEEAPSLNRCESSKKVHFLPLSSRSEEGLECSEKKIKEHLTINKNIPVADCAFTMQNGRQIFNCKTFLILDTSGEKQSLFKSNSELRKLPQTSSAHKLVFMFPGQGSQYLKMGYELYISEKTFRTTFDYCSGIIKSLTNVNLIEILYDSKDMSNASEVINQTRITQPLLFSFEYALAKLWQKYGLEPSVMIGHSIGEYVAACLSGVFSLNDALYIVCERGRIIQMQPLGKMLSINMEKEKLEILLESDTEIAVENSYKMCVVSGTNDGVKKIFDKLSNQKIDCRWLNTSHAFHSFMMENALNEFNPVVKKVKFEKPVIPYMSNVSGEYLSEKDIADNSYWGRHLRHRVRFLDGLVRLFKDGYRIFIEVGPGNTLSSFVNTSFLYWKNQNNQADEDILTVPSVRNSKQVQNDNVYFYNSIGKLWQHDISINFSSFYDSEKRYRVSIPGYTFQRSRFWIEPEIPHEICIGVKKALNYSETNNFKKECKTENTKGINESDTYGTVCYVWKDLLGLEDIDPKKNFFESGGDSIWASQLLSRIYDKTGVQLTLETLYSSPDIESLVEEINKIRQKNIKIENNKPCRSDLESGLPLSSSQLRLWFLNRLEPESVAHNLATKFEIRGPFKEDCAINAIDELVMRHDALRTTFKYESDKPTICIHKRLNFKLETLDLSNAEFNEHKLSKEICFRSIIPYDLSIGPLLRILIIKISDDYHILVVMTHHIVSDGWSMGVFLKDFAHLYQCLLNSSKQSLPELPYRFADYATWQNSNSGNINIETIEFWKNKLAGALPVLELPSFQIRPNLLSYQGSALSFKFNADICQKIEQISKIEQTTIFTVLLSIYYILLSKYSGQSDIIIGSPVANRKNTNDENLIGFFLNMIPLRINCHEKKTFKQFIKEVKSITEETLAHQNMPFDQIVEIVNTHREMNYHPVFQVMFAYQNFPIKAQKIGDTIISPVLGNRGVSEYDLSLYMWNNDGLLEGLFEYSTDLFEEQLIENVKNHFINIASVISENQDICLDEIKLLSNSEMEKILYSWNNTEQKYPRNSCIHDLFDATVKKYPAAISVLYNKQNHTYNELYDISNRISSYLKKTGVKTGDHVGVYIDRSLDMIASMLGILRSGAAYVPLDFLYPDDRLSYIIEDSGLKLILTQNKLKEKIAHLNKNVNLISVDNVKSEIEKKENGDESKISPENAAYIIYTSGSTGKPKGVRISHRSVVNFLTSMCYEPGIKNTDMVIASTTISFDISVLEIFLPLISGASVAVIPYEISHDAMKFKEIIDEIRPDIIQGTPSMWKMLLSTGWSGSGKIKALCGGETLNQELAKDLHGKVKELWNMYGPTETTVWATIYKVSDPDIPVSIGNPISNLKTYILDSYLKPVPIGVAGELYIGGEGLALGYHKRESLTKEKFIKNPYGTGSIYRTGDIARYRCDGIIDYVGRSDFQIKLRGHRIELGEIEAVALSNQSVDQCIAVCKKINENDIRLILFYKVKSGKFVTSSELRIFLKSFLPEYMIPQNIYTVDSIPILSSGKVDRQALIRSVSDSIIKDEQKIEPNSAEENYIAEIWKKTLGINTVGLKDNFYELGGHSLLSIKVISQIKKETGYEIQPRFLVMNTLEQVAASIALSKKEQVFNKNMVGKFISRTLSRFFKVWKNQSSQ